MRDHPFMGQLSNLYGVLPTRGSGAAYIVLRRCLNTIWSNRPWSTANMWFYRSVEEPSGAYQKRGPFGSRASPIVPVRNPVGLPLWCFRPIFGGCMRVVVPFLNNYNLRQTESEKLCPFYRTLLCDWYLLILDSEYGNWYIRFGHLDELLAMLHFNSSFGILICCSFVGVGLEYDWYTTWSPMTWQFLLFSRLVPIITSPKLIEIISGKPLSLY
jgi:hypothetical protein